MTNITFSIDDDIHKKMKNHPEIKWTEILRQSILDYLKEVEELDVLPIKDFRERLDLELLKQINELDEHEEILFYKKAKKMEEERMNRLYKLERNADE